MVSKKKWKIAVVQRYLTSLNSFAGLELGEAKPHQNL